MNPFENDNNKGGVVVSDRTFAFLESAGKWARFLAILGFIGIGIMVLFSLITIVTGSAMESSFSRYGRFRGGGAPVWLMGFGYLIGAVIAFFPLKFLNTFASRAIEIGMRRDSILLEEAIENLKSFFKFYGILTIVYMGLVALMVLFSLLMVIVR